MPCFGRAWPFGLVMLTLAAGCVPRMTIEQVRERMPRRPEALDRLDRLVGRWDYEGQARIAGLEQPLEVAGEGEARWGGDGWYVVSTGVHTIRELGDFYSQETWSYDPRADVYRLTWADSMGATGIGAGTFDPASDTWTFDCESYGPAGRTRVESTIRWADDDTLEMTWVETLGLIRTMEMAGTARRKR